MSVIELASRAKGSRHYIYLVESGKANFTIDSYVEMLAACGVSFDDAIASLRSSDIPDEHQPIYRALATVLRSNFRDLEECARVALQALAEKATRLQKIRGNDSPPTPPNRRE